MGTTSNIMLIFQILYVVSALGTMVIVISENRNPQKTISWVLVLLLLPLVGLIIYYFFGEDRRKMRLISRKTHKMINKTSLVNNKTEAVINVPAQHSSLIRLLNRSRQIPIYGGNKITFFGEGKDFFTELIHEIEKAKDHIHFQFYIIMDDELGHRIKDLLIKKAKEGVKVRLIYDDVGSWKSKRKFFDDMRKQGVEVQPFLTVKFKYLTSRVNYRNHRKVAIIDGSVGFMGGMNVADRYIHGINDGIWRDVHMKIEGKAVAGLQTSFIIDWYACREELLSSSLNYFPTLKDEGDNLVQIVTAGPTADFKGIHLGIIQAIYNAKESVYIQTPYFIPTDPLMTAIQQASFRGVDVRLMVPRQSDTTFVHKATMSFLKEAFEANVSVYFFEAGFLHSKLITIDDDLTITGSANMDVRSFEHNFEINAFIYNKETSKKAKDIFYNDMRSASLATIEEWENRSRISKFTESIVRMFSPLL